MKSVSRAEIKQIVRLLDKVSRVMATMKMRDDVLSFGQTQLTRRVYRLERQLARAKKGRPR